MSAVLNSKASTDTVERLLQAERTGAIRHFGRWIDLAMLCAVALTSLAFWGARPPEITVAWLTCAVAVSCVRLFMS